MNQSVLKLQKAAKKKLGPFLFSTLFTLLVKSDHYYVLQTDLYVDCTFHLIATAPAEDALLKDFTFHSNACCWPSHIQIKTHKNSSKPIFFPFSPL